MSASLQIPVSISAKTEKELTQALMRIQAREGGKVSIISIQWVKDRWVCWYYPIRNLGGVGV